MDRSFNKGQILIEFLFTFFLLLTCVIFCVSIQKKTIKKIKSYELSKTYKNKIF